MATGKLSNFKKETLSFFYTVFTLLFLISIFTHDPDDPSFFNSGLSDSVNNYIGIVGAYISFLFFYLFGKVSFLIPIILIRTLFQIRSVLLNTNNINIHNFKKLYVKYYLYNSQQGN